MAQRLATEFVNARLLLPESQMSKFMQHIQDPRIRYRVRVLESGSREIVLEDESGEEVNLPFDRRRNLFVCELSFRLVNPRLTHMIRRLFVAFRGDGMVRRIYPGFVMLDFYAEGSVRRIIELTPGASRLVFEHRDQVPELEYRFGSTDIEREIENIRMRVDLLLDRRHASLNPEEIERIDKMLRRESRRLFILEA
ncbi:non-ribosomal peptide synthetase module [Saccharibacillus alkalitolerans]|uniref:Non-ribosomal peptide synthetase module n=1 Tax=Saccharibacillus alkalitolerans TaxID=2705290 RepID=A0ABX0FC23_9BACL|nr:non-ribosomal peptide synthetase module [Saccharibacillus alkalitolerans]NGZ77535.1 non-ribosomal peptide synthetase module [Saccharibacillus alkalitolerans]